jgi:TetR/AcrR family transcriptional regulator, regulator of autoinduction and epiphytic fitness
MPPPGTLGGVASRDEVDPRIERSRSQVLAAAAEVLVEVGYGALTIEAVAARSGVAKSTIYRHWPGKPQLVADAFCHVHDHEDVAEPPPGPVRDRVAVILRRLAVDMGVTNRLACLVPALIDAAESSDEMAALAPRIVDERAQPLVDVLDEAVQVGELPLGTDTRLLADALVGPILLARLFHRPPIDSDDIPGLVDQLLPVARSPRSTPA